MGKVLAWVSSFLLLLSQASVFSPTGWCSQHAKTQQAPAASAEIDGRLTVIEGVGRSLEARPFRNVNVYLFDLEQSKPLLELQRKCRTATARPGNDFVAVNTCQGGLADAVKLVPGLTYTARVQSDRDGMYKFENVAEGRRYQVVSVLMDEGDPVVLVGLTPKLKAGQHVTLDLRENDPWTDADPQRH